MLNALEGLDRSDRDFLWMRGLGWGAGAGLMVIPVFVVIAIVARDAAPLLMGLLFGIFGFLFGTFAGGLVAWLGWKALLRGARPVWIVVLGSAFAALLIAAICWLGINLSTANVRDSEPNLFAAGLVLATFGPVLIAALFGLWFTVRNLVRRVELREERVLLPQ